MKQPRTSGFDPKEQDNVKPLKSSMEDFPAIEKRPVRSQVTSPTPVQPPRTPVHPVRVVRDVRPDPVVRRKIKSRHPFDIYEDQLDTLKALSLEDRMRGGMGSMSAMVREALDDYFSKVSPDE
jgi:hypothetical protein